MQYPPGQEYSWNIDKIGYCDLQGRTAFKMAIHRAADRWFLYAATFTPPGLNIIEITDPAAPRYARFIDGPPNTWTLQVQVADGKMITALEKIPDQFNAPEKVGQPFAEGMLIWDLADPENPKQVGHFKTGGEGTHRNYYDGGNFVYVTGLPNGYDGHILQIVDISDTSNPREVGRWWREGQWVARGEAGVPEGTLLHGGAYVRGDRAYLPYSAGGFVILDISDKSKPRLISDLPFSPPFQSFIAVHTALPLTKRELVVVNSEAIVENCDEPLGYVGIVDIKDETTPRLISLFPLPRPPEGAPYRNFCEKGGRFGPHNQHQWQYQDVLLHDENTAFLTYFNAGLRVYDISDERQPREIAYFIPPDPETRRLQLPATRLVCQTEDVLVDARKNIYITDKNHGIYVLRLNQPK